MSATESGTFPGLSPQDVVIDAPSGWVAEDNKAIKEEKYLIFKAIAGGVKSFWGGIISEKNALIMGLWVDLILRAIMAYLLFSLTSSWLKSVLDIIERQQSSAMEMRLSDTVMVTLLSTTTINVIGLLLTVALYLFPSSKIRKVVEASVRDQ